ncbi:MAG: ATP-binding protein [Sphingomonas sp.]
MYISEIYASGFRCFDPGAPLQLKLSSGLNILVGPNDAGKSAIIDAARYVLWTRGDDYIPPAEAKDLIGDRKTENELTQDEVVARLKTLRRDVGDPVDAFIADSWTLEFDLALRPQLAESVHQAVQLAKTSSRKPERLAKIVTKASETYAGWKEAGLSTTEIAVKIYQPVHDKEASKAEVAEQLAAILRKRTDTPEQMRDRLPPYLVRAIDYVTGGYVPGAPAIVPELEAEDEEIGGAGMEGAAAVEA